MQKIEEKLGEKMGKLKKRFDEEDTQIAKLIEKA